MTKHDECKTKKDVEWRSAYLVAALTVTWPQANWGMHVPGTGSRVYTNV